MQYENHHWTLILIERLSLKYFQKCITVWACLRPDSHLKIFFLEWAHWRAFSILTKLPGPSTLTHVKKIMSCCNLFLRDITSGGLVCMFLTERQAGGGGGEIGTLEHQTGGKHTPAATSIGGTQPQLTRVLQPLKTRSDICIAYNILRLPAVTQAIYVCPRIHHSLQSCVFVRNSAHTNKNLFARSKARMNTPIVRFYLVRDDRRTQ